MPLDYNCSQIEIHRHITYRDEDRGKIISEPVSLQHIRGGSIVSHNKDQLSEAREQAKKEINLRLDQMDTSSPIVKLMGKGGRLLDTLSTDES